MQRIQCCSTQVPLLLMSTSLPQSKPHQLTIPASACQRASASATVMCIHHHAQSPGPCSISPLQDHHETFVRMGALSCHSLLETHPGKHDVSSQKACTLYATPGSPFEAGTGPTDLSQNLHVPTPALSPPLPSSPHPTPRHPSPYAPLPPTPPPRPVALRAACCASPPHAVHAALCDPVLEEVVVRAAPLVVHQPQPPQPPQLVIL